MKLTIELIPKTSWCTSVRSMLSTTEWDRLRRIAYKRADYVCEICGESGLDQGKGHPVECHEIFSYGDDFVQTLDDLICLCPRCHMVKHIGRSMAIGKSKEAISHLAKVNEFSQAEASQYISETFTLWELRSRSQWEIDLSVLVEKYEVDQKVIESG